VITPTPKATSLGLTKWMRIILSFDPM
jgi:hypothetical protein